MSAARWPVVVDRRLIGYARVSTDDQTTALPTLEYYEEQKRLPLRE